MLEGLYGQSMLQGTSLNAFQTYHTAEHYRSMKRKTHTVQCEKVTFRLLGDFNAKLSQWNCQDPNTTEGTMLSSALDDLGLI